jgi:hypothetical protein
MKYLKNNINLSYIKYIMSQKSVTIIIVDKGGSLRTLAVKVFNVEELYKKCGFKKSDGFKLQVEWPVNIDRQRLLVQMYGKLNGKANMENKYDFPPPVDTQLYFGSCALVGMIPEGHFNTKSHINLTIELWNKIYEKLFGGFEDLTLTCKEDENEEDELENIPSDMKTKKGGYLKDGFVVDSETEEDINSEEDETPTEESETDVDCESNELEDPGSELSEESYIESDSE